MESLQLAVGSWQLAVCSFPAGNEYEYEYEYRMSNLKC